MSYVRFAWDGSDVYVYESASGIVCCGCKLHQTFLAQDPLQMIAHLAEHRAAGHFVPAYAIVNLWEDLPGASTADRPEPPEMVDAKRLMFEAEVGQMVEEYRKTHEITEPIAVLLKDFAVKFLQFWRGGPA